MVFILFELPANLCIKQCASFATAIDSLLNALRSFGTWLIPVSVVGFGLVTLCTAFVKVSSLGAM